MEWLILLVALAGVFLAPVVISVVALVRARRSERRVRELELELGRALDELRRPGAASAADRVAAAEAPTPARPTVGHAPVAASPVPPRPTPTVPVRTPATVVSPRPAPAVRSPATKAPAPASGPERPVRRGPTGPGDAPAPSKLPSKPKIEWERWVGIRGAAVLGAVALSLAGLLFFQYTIEHGLISPAMRVVLGTIAGLVCLTGASALRRRDYAYTADGLAGAGLVILYAAFWASHMLYGLVSLVTAFGLMVGVTAVGCWLATRHRSLFIAVAGLAGGFATPLLLSGAADSPLGLFGYVLLLDAGLLWVGKRGRWPVLSLLSLAGTGLMQALWIGRAVTSQGPLFGLLVLGVFAALFVLVGRSAGKARDRLAAWTNIGAIGLPFAFALYFAQRVTLGVHLVPLGVFLVLLSVAAGWMARELKLYPVSAGASVASLAVVGTWLAQRDWTAAQAWQAALVLSALALVFHAFVERERERGGTDGPATAALIALLGGFGLLLRATLAGPVHLWPTLVGWVALTALAYRHAAFPGRSLLQLAAAGGLAIGFDALHFQAQEPLVSATIFLSMLVAGAAGLLFLGTVRRADLRTPGVHAAAAFAAIVLIGMPSGFVRVLMPWPALGVAVLLGATVALAATWLRRGAWLAVAVAGTLFAQTGYLVSRPGMWRHAALSSTSFSLMLGTVVLLTSWPFLARERFGERPGAWRAAAVAGPLALAPLSMLWQASRGTAVIAAVPTVLGLVAAVAAWIAWRMLADAPATRRVATAWYAGVAVVLSAVAMPFQFEREWLTLGWALLGLALVALWQRLDHPGLKWSGAALLATATLRLIANPWVLSYHGPSGQPIVNWLLYTYLVPAAALLVAAALLRRHEVDRARAWEWFYRERRPVGAFGAGLAAIAVVFAWINLTIADLFATGARLTLDLGDSPAERLTVSIAWAAYALALLVIGMARKAQGLRWVSLCLLLVTIGKVFLYDVGRLEDLYRVASLVGLAVSLIAVSLLYQRFVFRRSRPV